MSVDGPVMFSTFFPVVFYMLIDIGQSDLIVDIIYILLVYYNGAFVGVTLLNIRHWGDDGDHENI